MIPKRDLYTLSITFLCSIFAVAALYFISEEGNQSKHPFKRNIDSQAIAKNGEYTLDNIGYYFAGSHGNTLYLGNPSTPLYITEIDTLLKKASKRRIILDDYKLTFRYVEFRICYPYFFLFDGYVPVVYRGRLDDLNATKIIEGKIYFSDAVVISPERILIRGQKPPNGEHILGLLTIGASSQVQYLDGLLQKQRDGIFDTDGDMAYDPVSGSFIYSHFYRNQIIIADSSLQRVKRSHTIDTVTTADLKLATMKTSGNRRMGAPPQFVNRRITASGGLLFVDSHLRARNDKARDLRRASSIDMYSLKDGSYISSFYLTHSGNLNLKEFAATPTALYTISGKALEKFSFGKRIRKNMNKQQYTGR